MKFLPVFLVLFSTSALAQSFTPDFSAWLETHYSDQDFSGAAYGVNSAYGGRDSATQTIDRRPVVLIHGNTDRAVGGESLGWQASIDGFLADGYKSSEIYAMTWGDGTSGSAVQNTHSEVFLKLVRTFLEAVLEYTQADQIDVIGHSMGVTLSRRAIKGSSVLGMPLTTRIHTFIGIAGGNRGVGSCLNPFSEYLPTCSRETGFHPESRFLQELNTDENREGTFVYSIWSNSDDLLNRPVFGSENPVPANVTSPIPGQDGEHRYEDLSHLGVRDQTVADQLSLMSASVAD